MQEHEREILSAMMDDQADTQAVSEVLNGGSRQSIQDQWYRWHQLRDLLQGVHRPINPVSGAMEVLHGVSQALDSEGPEAGVPGRSADHD